MPYRRVLPPSGKLWLHEIKHDDPQPTMAL
jgi:hypothetical protein